MTKTRSDARGQHYVPQMLQDAFTRPGKGKKPQLFVFDKHEDRVFKTSPENILHQRDFNTFESEEASYCLETGMGKVEDAAAPVLRKIITSRSLAELTDDERGALMVFVALQQVRGVSVRANMVDMVEQIRERIRQEGQDPNTVPQLRGHDDPEQIKLSALMLAGRNLAALTAPYMTKAMLLFAAEPGTRFYLGDTPVTMHNETDTGPYGNLGTEVEGIEIYMPIAPDLLLAFWCPSLVEVLQEGLLACERSLKNTAAAALFGTRPEVIELRRMRAELQVRQQRISDDIKAILSQRPIESSSDNVDYLNSLQVAYAERYLVSSTNDFSLARRMVAERPKARRGMRGQLA